MEQQVYSWECISCGRKGEIPHDTTITNAQFNFKLVQAHAAKSIGSDLIEIAAIMQSHLVLQHKPAIKENCASCKFGFLKSEVDLFCRRFPPSGHEFPIMFFEDWCGEWKERKYETNG